MWKICLVNATHNSLPLWHGVPHFLRNTVSIWSYWIRSMYLHYSICTYSWQIIVATQSPHGTVQISCNSKGAIKLLWKGATVRAMRSVDSRDIILNRRPSVVTTQYNCWITIPSMVKFPDENLALIDSRQPWTMKYAYHFTSFTSSLFWIGTLYSLSSNSYVFRTFLSSFTISIPNKSYKDAN